MKPKHNQWAGKQLRGGNVNMWFSFSLVLSHVEGTKLLSFRKMQIFNCNFCTQPLVSSASCQSKSRHDEEVNIHHHRMLLPSYWPVGGNYWWLIISTKPLLSQKLFTFESPLQECVRSGTIRIVGVLSCEASKHTEGKPGIDRQVLASLMHLFTGHPGSSIVGEPETSKLNIDVHTKGAQFEWSVLSAFKGRYSMWSEIQPVCVWVRVCIYVCVCAVQLEWEWLIHNGCWCITYKVLYLV